jgi:hypothetical protein
MEVRHAIKGIKTLTQCENCDTPFLITTMPIYKDGQIITIVKGDPQTGRSTAICPHCGYNPDTDPDRDWSLKIPK